MPLFSLIYLKCRRGKKTPTYSLRDFYLLYNLPTLKITESMRLLLNLLLEGKIVQQSQNKYSNCDIKIVQEFMLFFPLQVASDCE